MKTVVVAFLALCVVSALSLAEDNKKSKPSVTMSPAGLFGNSISNAAANVNTTTANTTTAAANTTTAAANTTTAAANTTTTAAANTTTTAAANTTTAAANTTTAAANTTTTAAANTTTAAANTTTAAANTTTTAAANTTTTAAANTTTAAANTTTAAANTTTAKPTAAPTPTPPTNLTRGNYTLTDKKGICLMAQMALQIRLSTTKANGPFIVKPDETTVQGGCQETTANLTLVFREGHITFMFNKSVAENMVYVDALSFALRYPLSNIQVSSEYISSNSSVRLFTAKVGHSYSCRKESLYMGNGLYLDVNQDRLQAFDLTKSNNFGSPDFCPADQHDYRVAVAIGIILLVLIILVVVVYLLSRRKRTDGYQAL